VHNARFRQVLEDFVGREREAIARFVAAPTGDEP